MTTLLPTKIIADFNTSLATACAIGGTSYTITSATDDDGVSIPTGQYVLTIDGGNSSKEYHFVTLTGTAITAVNTVTRQGVKTSGSARAHRVGATVTMTDFASLKYISDLLSGTTDLNSSIPLKYDGTATISDNNALATKAYADALAIAGSPDSSTTVKGIGKVSVAPVSAGTPIFVGDNDTRVPPINTSSMTTGIVAAFVGNNTDVAVGSGNKYVTQTGLQHNTEKYAVDSSGSSTAYVVTLSPVPTSLTDGMVVCAKILNANTTTNPTLNANSLGAKTIVKFAGSALSIGDILANQYCEFIYDLTNTRWVLKNPTIVIGSTSGVSAGPSSSSTQTITHSLGRLPVIIRTHCNGDTTSATGNPSISYGVYDGSGNRCVYTKGNFSGDPATSTTYSLYIDKSTATTGNATGIIGNVTSTSFDIVWTVTSTVGNCSFMWEAQ